MKCLSVRQPWAHLILNGPKDVENRIWAPAYRGPLLIHAGLTLHTEALHYLRRWHRIDRRQTLFFSCRWPGRRVDRNPTAGSRCGGMEVSRGVRAVPANRR